MRTLFVRFGIGVSLLASSLTAQTELVSLREEIVLSPGDIQSWNVPSDAIEAIEGGSLELRQFISLDGPARQLLIRTYAVPPTTPAPTSLVTAQNAELERFKVDIQELTWAPESIRIAGTVAATARAPITGAMEGAPVTFITQPMDEGVTTFSATRLSIEGGVTLYAFEGLGDVEFGAVPNNSPVIALPDRIEATSAEVFIDATQSYDPDGDELDFKWHVLAGAAALRGCETPTPVFQMLGGSGAYDVELTITDSRGAMATKIVLILFNGPF